MKLVFIRILPALFYACFILYLSSVPLKTPSFGMERSDLAYHAGCYFVFAFFLSYSFNLKVRGKKRGMALLIIAVASLYGVLMEFYQTLLPYRFPSFLDALANAVGASLAVIVLTIYYRLKAVTSA